jgi:hypothetical protein
MVIWAASRSRNHSSTSVIDEYQLIVCPAVMVEGSVCSMSTSPPVKCTWSATVVRSRHGASLVLGCDGGGRSEIAGFVRRPENTRLLRSVPVPACAPVQTRATQRLRRISLEPRLGGRQHGDVLRGESVGIGARTGSAASDPLNYWAGSDWSGSTRRTVPARDLSTRMVCTRRRVARAARTR